MKMTESHWAVEMKIIIASDSFKGCLSSQEVASILEQGIKKVRKDVEIIKISIADGGEGTINALVESTKGGFISCRTEDPLMKNINSKYGILGDNKTVVIEMAETCSINMVSGLDKNPMNTTTYGMGTQLKHALDKGFRKFIIGLGGACVNDGGLGMFQSLGFIFKDKNGKTLENGQGGKQLLELSEIDISKSDKRLKECVFVIASDVKNPLHGLNGAAYVYAPQKGATPPFVELLDKGLRNFAKVVKSTFGIDISELKGAGAAGGIGGGLIAFLNGRMMSGIDMVLDVNNFGELLKTTDLVITGEGRIDRQTLSGKVLCGIASYCRKSKVPLIAVCGRLEIDEKEIQRLGIKKVYEISDEGMPLSVAMRDGGKNLAKSADKIANDLSSLIN